MGRPKSRQAPRTTMSIRVSERERREIEEKAAATGMTPSAYIRTMALDGGNVDTTSHEDRQKLMYELSTIGNNINQIARMANTNVFISKSDVQEVNEQLKQIQRLLLQYIRNRYQITDNRCAWHLSIRECGISDEEYARLVLEAAE